jgi:pimeloyl-ACP methyl ester carboxylesterase
MRTLAAREEIFLHGHRICFRRAGDGPLVLLVHGITGSARHWERLLPALAERHTVLVPDLLGHGESAKPRGDYSLGAFASGLRDLLLALDCDRATVVGHSLGGGIAMQFAYQFPERCERLVLIDSGGLGTDVHQLLRAAALPGSELVLPLLTDNRLRGVAAGAARALRRVGLDAGPDLAEMVRGLDTLADHETRHAFLETLRAVIGPRGQKIDARDRLYLAEVMPTLIIWGEYDPIIPARHGIQAHELMPGSRLELLPAGHFPHLECPFEVARIIGDFIATTQPGEVTLDDLRRRVRAGAGGVG